MLNRRNKPAYVRRFAAALALLAFLACGTSQAPDTAEPTATAPTATVMAMPAVLAVTPAATLTPAPLATAAPAPAATAALPAPPPKDGVRNIDEAEAEQARRKYERLLRASWATDFSRSAISFDEIMTGGPPKDGIPSIDQPLFESVADADEWLDDREPVQVVDIAGDARAYPVQVMVWHELVNDVVGGEPVVITF